MAKTAPNWEVEIKTDSAVVTGVFVAAGENPRTRDVGTIRRKALRPLSLAELAWPESSGSARIGSNNFCNSQTLAVHRSYARRRIFNV